MSDLIPDGWNESTLGQLVDARSSNVDKKTVEGELPVLLCNYTDVYYNNKISRKIPFMRASAKNREIERFTLKAGDVIITKDSETPDDIAVPTYVTENLDGVLCGYHLTLLRPNNKKSCGEYLAHLFQLSSVRHHFYLLASGITRFGLTADAITNAPLVVPPLPEQQKIAAILTSVDEVIEKTQAQIDKLKDLKTGMMQQLLTKGVGIDGKPHTEFKDSPVGRIPKGWEFKPLNDYVSFLSYGFTNPMPESEFGPYMITAKDVYGLKVQYASARKTTESAFNDLLTRKSRPEVDDILLTKDGTLGRVAIVKSSNCCINQSVAVMTPNDKILPKFLLYLLASPAYQREMLDKAGGSTIKHIYITVVDKMIIAVPTLDEQESIVNVIDALLNKIELSEGKLSKIKSTKKALMQDLLTGKVRVNVSSEATGH